MLTHFGISVHTDEPYLTRDNYISLCKDVEFRKWYRYLASDIFDSLSERVEFQKKCAVLNYDINMAYYKSLDESDFNSFINEKLVKNPRFVQVDDLKKYSTMGLYVMVLDRYKRVYIGISNNIRERIRNHWSKRMDISRLIFAGGVLRSKLSIDSFRVLDTTRIFVYEGNETNTREELEKLENRLVEEFPSCYSANRMMGGNVEDVIKEDDCFKSLELLKITKDNIKELLPNYSWKEYKRTITIWNKIPKDMEKYEALQQYLIWEEKEKKRLEEKRRFEESLRKRKEEHEKHIKQLCEELAEYDIDIDRDFPDYKRTGGVGYNLDVIKNIVVKSKKKGYDVSIYKGLKSKVCSKVFVCLENGIPADEAIDYANSFLRITDLKKSFKK